MKGKIRGTIKSADNKRITYVKGGNMKKKKLTNLEEFLEREAEKGMGLILLYDDELEDN